MKVLLSVASLKPSYGGPAHSVSQLANSLDDLGVEAGVWTPDGSAADSPLLVGSVTRLAGTVEEAFSRFGQAHVVHDNGIWLAHNHRLAALSRRAGVPRVVSLRGMLEPWARRHKAWKKRVAWLAYQRGDLLSAQILHATATAEANNLSPLGLGRPVEVIGNGIPTPVVAVSAPATSDRAVRTALFLGRIYPVKGLPMLIEAWSQVRPAGWRLCIAGPDEANHKSVVEAAIRRHNLSDVVDFAGPVAASEKAALFSQAELFVLPSHSESFGMAVGEALAHGLPVLTTQAVPWPQLETEDCGWRVEATASALAQGLRAATATPSQTLAQMGARGRALIVSEFSWDSAAQRMLRVYERLAGAA